MKTDPVLYKGRPGDRRIDKEERCYALLDSLGIEYYRADHEHAGTIEDCHDVEKLLGAEICKNLLLTNRQMTEVYLLLMPGDKPFRTRLLSKQIGTARLSFASGVMAVYQLLLVMLAMVPVAKRMMVAMMDTPTMTAEMIHMVLAVLLLASAVAQSPAAMAFLQALPATIPMMEVMMEAMLTQPQQVSTEATHRMMLMVM